MSLVRSKHCAVAICPLLLACLSAPALAQLPLSIEDLLVKKDVVQLETGFAYTNTDVLVQQVQWLQLPEAPGLSFPTSSVYTRTTDISYFSTQLRYGLNQQTELNIAARYAHAAWRDPYASDSKGSLDALTLGGSWLASPENETPAALLSFSVDVAQTSPLASGKRNHGKTARLGLTLYQSIDPVVVSLAVGYEYAATRTSGDDRLNPGDQFYLMPNVNFAINHKITLIGGLGLRVRQHNTFNGKTVSRRKNITSVLLGLGFAPSGQSNIFLQSRFATGANRSANISVDWSYTF